MITSASRRQSRTIFLQVILAFGLNDRTQKGDQANRNLKANLKMAHVAFPHARVLVPEVNFSRSLPHAEQDNLRRLNTYIVAHCHSVPALPRNSFSTEKRLYPLDPLHG
ncbi:unnamed protein product [Boreogadus saida]